MSSRIRRRSAFVGLVGVMSLLALHIWIVVAQPEQQGIDMSVLLLAQGSELPGSRLVLSAFSRATDTQPLIVASAMVGVGAWLAGSARMATSFWGVSILGSLVVSALKRLVDRPRPQVGQLVEASQSWPSGHSAGSLVYALCLVVLIRELDGLRGVRGLALSLIPAALTVGYSRAFLEVHWATDVVAGWLVAVVAATLFASVVGGIGPPPAGKGSVMGRRIVWLYAAACGAVTYLVLVGVTAAVVA